MFEYSKLFTTVYDADAPGVRLKFSILRAMIAGPKEHYVCVFWDEDHDVRVVEILEDLYLAGRLQDFIGISERKANVTLYTADPKTRPMAEDVEISDGDTFTVQTEVWSGESIGALWKLGTYDIEPRKKPIRGFPGDRDELKRQCLALGLCKLENRFGSEKLRELLAAHAQGSK